MVCLCPQGFQAGEMTLGMSETKMRIRSRKACCKAFDSNQLFGITLYSPIHKVVHNFFVYIVIDGKEIE